MEAGVCTDQETDGHSVTVSTALCLDSTALLPRVTQLIIFL